MTSKELEVFKNTGLENISLDTLTELKNIQINIEEEKRERILNFLKDGKNPYVFKHNDIIVKCSFADGSGNRIEEHIERYLAHFLQK